MNSRYMTHFFQNERKFIVGKTYETIRIEICPYTNYANTMHILDELGVQIPDSEIFLGKYVSSYNYGYGHNSGRCDIFINNKGKQISNYLDYDGRTRYRQVKDYIDERVNYLMMIESIGYKENINGTNEYINKYILNEDIAKEICSFMSPFNK